MDIFWWKILTLKVSFWHFLPPPQYVNSKDTIVSFEYGDFWIRIYQIMYPSLGNPTTHITIMWNHGPRLKLLGKKDENSTVSTGNYSRWWCCFECYHYLGLVGCLKRFLTELHNSLLICAYYFSLYVSRSWVIDLIADE